MSDSPPNTPQAGRYAASSRPAPGQNPLDWAREIGASDRVLADLDRYLRRRQRRRQLIGMAAMVALSAAATIWQPWRIADPVGREAAGGRAVVLQPERQALPDGTTVELKRGAAIEVLFEDSVRRVALHGGAAHFTVAKDAARPFVVAVGGVEARAVGTAFAVDPVAESVAVLVTEGCVAVAPSKLAEAAHPTATARPVAFVNAGEGVRLGTTASVPHEVEAVPAAEVSAMLAWRVPRLEFTDTPLTWVAGMITTHGGGRIVLGDDTVGGLRVSGVLRVDDPESLMRLLETEFGLKVERREGAWHVRRG